MQPSVFVHSQPTKHPTSPSWKSIPYTFLPFGQKTRLSLPLLAPRHRSIPTPSTVWGPGCYFIAVEKTRNAWYYQASKTSVLQSMYHHHADTRRTPPHVALRTLTSPQLLPGLLRVDDAVRSRQLRSITFALLRPPATGERSNRNQIRCANIGEYMFFRFNGGF